ncbi:MAG: sigma-70 family RNA polymerase sigma factor [Deltaproteobacteria bacterium]|nr:sigma-70 family RNA polymerase sigma factor [Deltaproteobacteria bacterium]
MERAELSTLYRRLGPAIYRRCLRLLADPDAARDAAQEVFVRACKHIERLDPGDRECLPWLYRVATNYCLNQLRGAGRMELRESSELPEPACRQGSPSAEHWLVARDTLMALLDRLDEKTRRIAIYAHMDGMAQDEIASLMGLSRKTVGKKLARLAERARELGAELDMA